MRRDSFRRALTPMCRETYNTYMKNLLAMAFFLYEAMVWAADAPGLLAARGLVDRYFDEFNSADEELYKNEFENSRAAATIGREIPLFECPDPDIERTYYFRWWTYRKHIRRVKGGSASRRGLSLAC